MDEAARPIPNAEVLLVDAEDVEEPEFWVDVDLVRWIADRKATPLLRTDRDGVLAIDDAPSNVWGLIRDRDRSAVVRIHPRDHRNRRVTLQVDRPLRIRTVDGDGRLVQGASVEVLQSYHGTRCGYWLELGTLLIDAAGEAMLRNPRYYVDAYVLEKPAESARIGLRATAADTRTVYRQLDPAECVSGGVVEVVLASKPESPAPRQDRTVRLQLRDNAGAAHRDGYVWFTIAGDPNGPLARETRRGACKNGCVQVTFAGDLPGDARVFVRGSVSDGRRGYAVLDAASLAAETPPDIVLQPDRIEIVGSVVDSYGQPLRDVRVSLRASLPMRDDARDRAAAVRGIKDPTREDHLLWSLFTSTTDGSGRFELPAPWDSFGGEDARWFLVAEASGWWRSEPVRLPESGSPIRIELPRCGK